MTWIPTVAPRQVISSATWANPVRDRIVQTFGSLNEANTYLAGLPEGATCSTTDTGLMYRKTGGIWRAMLARVVGGALVNPNGYYLTGGQTTNILTMAIPAGYRAGLFSVMSHNNTVGQDVISEIKMYLSNGGTLIGAGQWREINNGQSRGFSTQWDVNVNGDTCIVTVANLNGPGTGDLVVNGNGYYTRCSAMLTP